MFEIVLKAGNLINTGANLEILEVSDWSQSDLGDRGSYGVILLGEFFSSTEGMPIWVSPTDSLTTTTWILDVENDGRYKATAYVFKTVAASVNPQNGDYALDVNNILKQYDGAAWVVVVDLEAAYLEALYTGNINIPILERAHGYKNLLNLQYIAQVKSDIAKGATQNKMYYKRSDLDYYNALLSGAMYNFAIEAFSNFYEIVVNLNDIRINRQKC